jgi:tRNA-specific 2-thiouridylase
VHRFTVGQRKGIGVALGKPAFVTAIDAESGTVRLGDEKDLASSETVIEDIVVAPGVALPVDARVRIRYRHEGALGRVERSGDEAARRGKIAFAGPVRAVSRGQIAVFYDGDRVLGGARIC